MNTQSKEFDLAFSFAGEDRPYIEEVKVECEKLGLSVYYDQDRLIDQWGKSFIGEQREVYSGNKTKHFVPFISKNYFSKPIPTDEFKSALMESTKNSRYILPIKLDSSEVSAEYLHHDTQYLKKDDYSPQQLAGALKYIVDSGKEPAKDIEKLLTDELSLSLPNIIPRSYSKFEEAEGLLTYLADKFEKHLPLLKDEGYVPIVRKNSEKIRIMIERNGKTLFVMNLFFSNMGENIIGFNFAERSIMANAQSENGNIEPIFDKDNRRSAYLINDYTNIHDQKNYTKKEIMEYFWDNMNRQLEAKS